VQDAGDQFGFIGHLAEGESDNLERVSAELKAATPILVEGGPAAVKPVSVCFHDEPAIAPHEVDLETGDFDVDLGIGYSVAPAEA
jgi:hypothetical protein